VARYQTPTGPEAAYQPGSRKRVLRNLLGITSKVSMDRTEAEALITVSTFYYQHVLEATTRIDAELIRHMHRDWLGKIYSWAGEYRTVELSKDNFSWPPAYLIPGHMEQYTEGILKAHTPCRPRALVEVCRSIAVVHAELLLIHPFREGNGRLARWIADVMAVQAGYAMPSYRFQGKGARSDRAQYLIAVTQGYYQHYDPLSRFFKDAIRRGEMDSGT
jgi:cell filamentation protein